MSALLAEPREAYGLDAPTAMDHSRSLVQGAKLTEAQLFEIWRGQRFPEGALVTRQGVPVRVIFPGRPGRGPGPDFRGASIAAPSGATVRGDVELHVAASMFRAHGHLDDQAYANVILHVVFEDDTEADTLLPGGKTAPVIALAPWVARRRSELERWLDRPLLWQEPCHDAVLRLGAAGVIAALDSEGDGRFDEKAARWQEVVSAAGIDQALYVGMAESLGYGGNAPAMRRLTRLLPWHTLDALAGTVEGRPDHMTKLLLAGAGLLPSQPGHFTRTAEQPQPIRCGLPPHIEPMQAGDWKLWGVRPANHPVRRIAALAMLLSQLGRPSAVLVSVNGVNTREAVAPLLVHASGFWARHYDVGAAPCPLPAALIGRSRALEMLVNVVLPIAAAAGDPAQAEKARSLYERLPRPAAYGSTKFIENALGSVGIPVPVNARRAQGLLALNRDWCTQNGCGRCVLSRLENQESRT